MSQRSISTPSRPVEPLTEIERKILDFMVQYLRANTYQPSIREIGERFGSFDLSLIEIGAWHPSWGQIHLGPENAMRVHELVRAKTFMPVHWGTFSLALHAWDQPIVHLMDMAERADVQLLSPMMGESVHRESGVSPYWRDRRAGQP